MPFAPYIHLPPYSSFIFDTFALSWSQECVTGGKAMLRLGPMTLVFCTLSATYPAGWVFTGWESRMVGLEPKLATSQTQPTHPPKLCKHCYINKLTCFFQQCHLLRISTSHPTALSFLTHLPSVGRRSV